MAKVKIQGHASGTGVLTVTAPNTSTDRTITLPDATGTLLNSDGDGSSLTSLPAHTGNVAFPATQVASADANTLDDYEEGTWTPTLYGATTSTYTTQQGHYVKIGKCVYVAGKIEINSVGDGNAQLVSGLPFTVSNSVEQSFLGSAQWYGGSNTYYSLFVNPRGTITSLQIFATTTAVSTVIGNNFFQNSSILRFTAFYFI